MNIQGLFPLGLTDLISLQSKRLKSLLQHCNMKASILQCSAFFMVELSHLYMTTGKAISLITIQTFVSKVLFLLFNMLSFRFVIAFLPRNKRVLILRLQLPSAVILEPKKRKSVTASTFPSSICHEWWNWMHDISFLNVVLSQPIHSPLSPSRCSLVFLYFLPSEWYHLHIWGCWYFSWQSWF